MKMTRRRILGASLLANVWAYLAIGAGVLLLLGLRRHALRQLNAIALHVGDFSRDHFGLSLAALGWRRRLISS